MFQAVAKAVSVSRAHCGCPAGPACPCTRRSCSTSTFWGPKFKLTVSVASGEPCYQGAELHGHLPPCLDEEGGADGPSLRGGPLPPTPHSEAAAAEGGGVKGWMRPQRPVPGSLPGAFSDPPAVPSPHWVLGSAPWQRRETPWASHGRGHSPLGLGSELKMVVGTADARSPGERAPPCGHRMTRGPG